MTIVIKSTFTIIGMVFFISALNAAKETPTPFQVVDRVGDQKIMPKLGKLKNFRDWGVGCNNVGTCQAVSFLTDSSSGETPRVTITRSAGTMPKLVVEIYNLAKVADRYRIIIDGKIADTGLIEAESDSIRVGAADAMKLTRAMAKGYQMEIFDTADRSLGKVSLSGSYATMAYMDEQQNIARTAIAFVAKGKNNYRPKPSSVPIIAVRQITDISEVPPIADILKLAKQSGCDEEQFGVTEDRAYSLGSQKDKAVALVLISCGLAAYNGSAAPFIGTKTDGVWSFASAKFDYQDAVFTNENGTQLLSNVRWQADKQILDSYYKGRGLGDCGNSADYVWDGDMFRLIAAASMDPCRGAWRWIELWRAEPVYKQ